MQITSYKTTCTSKRPEPFKLKFNNLFNEHSPKLVFFFKSIFSLKTLRNGGELLLKNVQKMVTPINNVIARAKDITLFEVLQIVDSENAFTGCGKNSRLGIFHPTFPGRLRHNDVISAKVG